MKGVCRGCNLKFEGRPCTQQFMVSFLVKEGPGEGEVFIWGEVALPTSDFGSWFLGSWRRGKENCEQVREKSLEDFSGSKTKNESTSHSKEASLQHLPKAVQCKSQTHLCREGIPELRAATENAPSQATFHTFCGSCKALDQMILGYLPTLRFYYSMSWNYPNGPSADLSTREALQGMKWPFRYLWLKSFRAFNTNASTLNWTWKQAASFV